MPVEKGSWSLVFEPIVLGLLVAPSWAGVALAVGAFALFLFNRPFKIVRADRQRGRVYERTALARRFAAIYGLVALAGFAAGFALGGPRPFAALAMALPLLALFMIYDQRPGRFRQAELAAPVAFAVIAAALALADGWAWAPALALWGFMAARSLPAVMFIRARLRLDKGKAADAGDSVAATLVAHVAAVAAVAALVWPGWLPWTALLAAVMLLARAIWGLSAWRWRSSVVALGFLETAFGLLAVILVAVGYGS